MTNLELARRNRKWTLVHLGTLPHVRISPSWIGFIENKRAVPSDDQRRRLAAALDLPPERLLDEVPDLSTLMVPVVDEPEHADAPAAR